MILDTYSVSTSSSDLLKQRATHKLDACSAILVSDSDLLKYGTRRATHKLDVCSAIFFSDLLKHIGCRATHILDTYSTNLVSGSGLLKH